MEDVTLLALAIGPVQDFIAKARRTRDLWFGSHLLSELSKAAAKSLADGGWTLVFPGFAKGDPALTFCGGRLSDDGKPVTAVVNKILARAPADGRPKPDPERAAREAREAVLACWTRLAAQAHARGGKVLRDDVTQADLEVAIEDVLEFYAGWATGDYDKLREEIDEELAARKHFREFGAWKGSHLPKSSLDGFRETVLIASRENDSVKVHATKGRLGKTEQLDAIGFVKRYGGEPDQFPPVARVAVQPWVEAVRREGGPVAKAWKDLGQTLQGVGGLREDTTAWAADFPFDGEVFFEGQWNAIQKESERFDRVPVQALLGLVKAPSPYVACLVADGDGIGKCLSDVLKGYQQHGALSLSLADFAKSARRRIEEHGGALVYAGGDDVLALIPVATALEAAQVLAAEFTQGLERLVPIGTPTLSVGIGIAHFQTALGDLLNLARRAEKLAKGAERTDGKDRNALGVILSKRGGADAEWRAQWSDEPIKTLHTIRDALLSGALPAGFAYEIRKDVVRRTTKSGKLIEGFEQLFADEIRRTWRRKQSSKKDVPGLKAHDFESVMDWLEAFAIAKHLYEHHALLANVARCPSREEVA